MWPNMMSGIFGGWSIIGIIFMFIFWIILIPGIILLVVWLVRRTSYTGKDLSRKNDAIDILNERYVRGEINKEDFERMKRDIS